MADTDRETHEPEHDVQDVERHEEERPAEAPPAEEESNDPVIHLPLPPVRILQNMNSAD